MKTVPLLTIAFPTFNRCNAIAKRIEELFLEPLSGDISVLVVDNNSTDGTWDKLLGQKSRFPELHLARNRQNLGFAGNFITLFEECPSTYLMVMSDEDAVNLNQLPAYLRFLRDSGAALISPQAIVFNSVYRGRGRSKAILPTEFRDASNYISGCTFHTEKSRAFLPRITSVISSNSAAHVYPQVLLSGELLLEYTGIWYPQTLSIQSQDLDTNIYDLDGSFYGDLPSRCRQTLDLLRYFDESEENVHDSTDRRDGVERIRERIRADFFHQFRSSLRAEGTEFAEAFDSQARKFYRRGSRIKMLLGRAARNPRMVMPALRRRLFQSGRTEAG